MHRHFVLVVTLLFSLFFSSAHADNTALKTPATSAQKSSAPQRGVLYRASYRGNTCYLFGTVHVGQAAFYPLEPQVTRALSAADKLVLEVDIRDTAMLQQSVMRHGIYPEGQSITQHLSNASLEKLKQALQVAGTPFDNVARMKPWMVTNLLIAQAMARAGYPTEQGIELYLLAVAKKENKLVQQLETADYQLSLFNGLSDAQQEEYLLENLAQLADGSAIKKGLALITAWQHADNRALQAALQELQSEQSTSAKFLQRVLLDERNPNMANKIETLLKTDKKSFVAVGALHLIGDKGVPELLRQRGYKVQKLY
ncbi:TraB/GumN family protein [Herminiimonas aquatilis]|uniref:TraB/GumN family protein n=1 Tax=Herminiimonas aquatilis TaxID=345342 RepID=A0ABW2J5H2_9BURK